MADKSDSDWSVRLVTKWLPWLLGACLFAVYLITLNRWVSLDSLRLVTSVSGLNWRRELFSPVTFLATYPLSWLPAGWIPLALNLLTAVCASLSLVLLARCVALLPHDRTHAERARQRSGRTILTIRSAWLPPTLAVLICGWQLTFWEHAVAGTGEMLDLLLFAYLVRCLLEFRRRHKPAWLVRLALVHGLAVANNWAMAVSGPAFIVAIIWMNEYKFFDVEFLRQLLKELRGRSAGARVLKITGALIDARLVARLIACWLAGFSLFLLLPLLASVASASHVDFWPTLRQAAAAYKQLLFHFLRYLFFSPSVVLMAGLTSVAPVLFMGIRWPALDEDADASIKKLVDILFYVVHGFFLAVCLWTALDSPFSPRGLKLGLAGLPLYFLSALSVGYFSGSFLLVFGSRSRHGAGFVGRSLTASIWLLAIAVPALLFGKNVPEILWKRSGPLAGYAAQLRESLPPGGAVILSDDPFRLRCLESALIRADMQTSYLPIDTTLLSQGLPYLQFLDRKHPGFKLIASSTNSAPERPNLAEWTNRMVLTDRLRHFSQVGGLYSLQPAFGDVAEVFHAEPQRLLYQLKADATNGSSVTPMSPAELAENRTFWLGVEEEQIAGLAGRIQPAQRSAPGGLIQRILKAAHVAPETDREALAVGSLYSAGLDYWGVELQRRELLTEAEQCFSQAQRLNPDNAAAQINVKANKDLQARRPFVVQSLPEVETRLGKALFWNQKLRDLGPVDEPNYCFHLGTLLADGLFYRQAVEQFERVKALAPDYPNVRLRLAQSLLMGRNFTNALVEARQLLRTEPRNPQALLVEGLALFQTAAYVEAIPPLTEVLTVQTNELTARLYRGWSYLKLDRLEAARQDYERVAQATPRAFAAYYGLAEIAYRNKDTAAAVRNCELYLGSAPPSLPETQVIRERLKELQRD